MNKELTVGEVASEIVEFIRTETSFDSPSLIEETTRLFELGIVDSLMIMSLISFCETSFQRQFSPDELTEENLSSPIALARLIAR